MKIEDNKKLRILNAYAGIGGNRKNWDSVRNDLDITAVEIDPKIAKIYQDFFPQEVAKHYFWTNFFIHKYQVKSRGMGKNFTSKMLSEKLGYQWETLIGLDREKVLRNCVEPELGLHIFQEAYKEHKTLF